MDENGGHLELFYNTPRFITISGRLLPGAPDELADVSEPATGIVARLLLHETPAPGADHERAPPTPGDLQEVLWKISPEVERDVWVKIAAALKHEGGDAARQLFLDWSFASERWGDDNKAGAAAELYDSLQPRGNVTFGTLVYLAKKHPRTTPAEETNTTTTVDGFIRIKRELWRRPEVGGLSPIAKLILVELHYCYTGTNNGELCLPYLSLVRRIRCSRASIKRAFGELHQAGLIETTVSGSFDHKGGARKGVGSRYRLTRI
jgi:hypothetical protein